MESFDGKIESILASASPEPEVLDQLWPVLYDELRHIARLKMRTERHITYQPTALVNEVYVRLQVGRFEPTSRRHLIYAASRAMWQVLIDAGRRRRAEKRGAGRTIHISETEWLEMIEAPPELRGIDVEILYEALERLRGESPNDVRALELTKLQGYTPAEAGEIMNLKPDTIVRYAGNAMRFFRAQAAQDRQ